jgi:uncharacterized protein YutE (UPF0331/DUF86 family)
MDSHTEARILEKAEYIRESLTILAETRDATSFELYQNNRRQRNTVEREFQTSIEASIDIGSMILRAEDRAVPSTNAAVFHTLSECGVLSEQVSHRMSEAAGFRNILSHKYGDDINNQDIYNFLQHDLQLFSKYLREVRNYLDSKE